MAGEAWEWRVDFATVCEIPHAGGPPAPMGAIAGVMATFKNSFSTSAPAQEIHVPLKR